MTETWFTSDHHFNHGNIIRLCDRPFVDVRHMEEFFITSWNAVVSPKDTVHYLGDFAWKCKSEVVNKLLSSLNGTKHLIRGNHDNKHVLSASKWASVQDYKTIKIDNIDIIMFHYPIRSWWKMARGSWMLHGHCHGNLPTERPLIWDVGVDVNPWAPVSFATLKDRFRVN